MVVWFLVIMAIGAGLLAIPGWVPLQLAHAPLIDLKTVHPRLQT